MNLVLGNIEPNAHYDMVHGMPTNIERDNDGSYLFRYNIKEEYATTDQDGNTLDEPVQTGWSCVEIRMWEKPNHSNVKREIIRSQIDECEEFAIVNKYNMNVLGVHLDDDAVARYKAYLQFTLDIDTMFATVFTE